MAAAFLDGIELVPAAIFRFTPKQPPLRREIMRILSGPNVNALNLDLRKELREIRGSG